MLPEMTKARLLSLFVECPTGNPLVTCPMSPLRKLPMEDRIEVSEKAGPEIIEKLLTYHEACMHKRRNC
jgi:hypothetical protein